MGTSEAHNLKSEVEILARQSRPQRNSTWIPKTRDWRYATGVIQHDDFEDAPKSRSVWDTMDYDFQTGGRNNTPGSSRSGSGSVRDSFEAAEAVDTPKSMSLRGTIEPAVGGASPLKAIDKPMFIPKGLWRQVTRLTVDIEASLTGIEPAYKVTGVIVRLRFTRKNKTQLKAIVERPIRLPTTPVRNLYQDLTTPMPSPNTPASARTAKSVYTPHKLDSIESVHEFPLFKRVWNDETYDFNIATVRSRLRSANVEVDELGANYEWYTDAVSIDAIFPPGVPISAKEISAFYPHHVRWKGVMIRLTNNDYRGPDIMGMQAHFRGAPDHPTPPAYMNNYQRDVVKTAIPEFKTTSYKGKTDRNLSTDQLTPGPYIHGVRKGHTLPTFEDLVRGLQRLPAGLDARGLTQCLSWYISMRNTFTPKLEMNVLHVQSLIRAYREPLKPFGPQNLDRNALEQWRNTGTFETVEIEENAHLPAQAMNSRRRTQLHLNLDNEDVSMNLTLPIRHILTFPFLALHGVVGEAFKMGIDRAKRRQEEAVKRALEAKWAAKAAMKDEVDTEKEDNSQAEPTIEVSKEPYRTPKRPHPVETEQLAAHKKPNIPMGPRITTAPRRPAAGPSPPIAPAAPRPSTPSHQQGRPYSNWSWSAHGPSSGSAPQYQRQPGEYGRRFSHGGHPNPRYAGVGPPLSEGYLQSGAHGHAGQDSLDYVVDEYGNMIDLYGNVVRRW